MRLAALTAIIAGNVETTGATCSMDMAGYDDEELHAVVGAAVNRFMANRQAGGGGGAMARRGNGQQQRQGFGPQQTRNGTYQYPPLPAVGMHPPSKLRSFVGLGVISWT